MKGFLSWLADYVNSVLRRASSRKFVVFATATALLVAGKLDEWVWFWVAVAYMGANVLKHFLDAWHSVYYNKAEKTGEVAISFKSDDDKEEKEPVPAVGFRPPIRGEENDV